MALVIGSVMSGAAFVALGVAGLNFNGILGGTAPLLAVGLACFLFGALLVIERQGLLVVALLLAAVAVMSMGVSTLRDGTEILGVALLLSGVAGLVGVLVANSSSRDVLRVDRLKHWITHRR